MSRTITAMFDTRADAEAGLERLLAANIDADNARIHDGASMNQNDGRNDGLSDTTSMSTGSTSSSMATSAYSTSKEPGIWGSIKNALLPDEDRHTYEEGMRRGGFVLTADVDEDEIDAAVAALEGADSVDIDERAQNWRNDGWNTPTASTPTASMKPAMFGDSTGQSNMATDEQVIPVIEEQLVVGKREVERGGVRVRSYVTEMPVHEQIRLRAEKVNVERRPVDRAVGDMDSDAFRERTIEMTETSEEAVIGKTARVVEEVVVSKSSDEHVEDISETVRRTDVDVENVGTSGTGGTSGSRDAVSGGSSNTGSGSTLAGMANEAIGNVKQGVGDLTGSESLKRSGEAQERSGEMQQGNKSDPSY